MVGVPLLLPTALPSGCAERERFGVGAPINVAYFTYTCVTISEQAVVRNGVAHREQLYVGAGAIQEVSVDGWPAYFVRGAWGVDAQGQQVWQGGAGLQLVLERDGLLIRLSPGDASGRPEEGLLRIARSLQAGELAR